MKSDLLKLLDINEDGDVDVEDIRFLLVRHEWLFVAGVIITMGSLANVLGYMDIDSDLFWTCAGLGMMLEYLDDIRRRRKLL
jgi:hypothetical protein|tara:strand:- start:21023 stop:21268 length:246 start_codon:yes stop_codon:yes gene_type:complete